MQERRVVGTFGGKEGWSRRAYEQSTERKVVRSESELEGRKSRNVRSKNVEVSDMEGGEEAPTCRLM